MTEAEQVAAFIAKRGVTRVAEGDATMSPRQMYCAVRGRSEDDLIHERHVVVDHCGRERVRNGLGEWIS